MELILTAIAAFPIGYFAPTRRLAVAIYLSAWAVVLPIQTINVHDAGHLDVSYPFVNAAILAIGVWLTTLGARLKQRRKPEMV